MVYINDDKYESSLRDQRYFGAGIRRKRINFVASTSTQPVARARPPSATSTVAARYLSTVLPQRQTKEPIVALAPIQDGGRSAKHGSEEVEAPSLPGTDAENLQAGAVCEICHRPFICKESSASHFSSISHQICLQHSHPPSHVDRRRKGLAVLEGQGWDPDGRKGLGRVGDGILHPLKTRGNAGKAGLGLHHMKSEPVEKPTKLDAGKVRLLESEGKKKAARLREAFYRNEDVEKYLGV